MSNIQQNVWLPAYGTTAEETAFFIDNHIKFVQHMQSLRAPYTSHLSLFQHLWGVEEK